MKLLRLAILATVLFSMNNARAATLTESPGFIAQGGTVTATWSGVAAPSNRDWIGLYKPSEPDASTNFIDWIYDNSCNRAGNNSVLAAGSCNFLIPNSLANGTYELRLYANNSYILLAKSGTFSVAPARYVDNGDGTISDTQTGLMWEKKLAADDVGGNCTNATQANRSIRCVNNTYQWSSTGTLNDGSLFTNFLAGMTLGTSANGVTVTNNCLAGHCDWRIPNIAELRTILLAACPAGPGGPDVCIDPIFGPTQANFYWSSTTDQSFAGGAWSVIFNGSGVFGSTKDNVFYVRAVRGDR